MSKFVVFTALVNTLTFIVGPVIGCYSSISSFGTTHPFGDISRLAGSDLVINCTLNDNYTGPSDSSDIGWSFEDTAVTQSFVTVLDPRTAQLRIDNLATTNSGKYNCILRSSKTSLCLNVVTVGVPPPKINEQNFRCRSEGWRNLTCRWDVPDNPTPTTWKLYYRLPQGNASCPVHVWNQGAHRCFFNESTYPAYRQAAPFFYFVLTGNNTYGTSVSQFKVDHFKNVVPSPPKEFTVILYGNTGVRASWTMESLFRIFPVPLVFQLRYRSQWDPPNVFQKIEVTNRTVFILDNLIPYTEYEFIIQCRSERASDNETMWSSELRRSIRTGAEAPTSPLETVTGCFDDVNVDMDRRNITVYWKSLPEMLHHGPNFTYSILVLENNIETNIRPVISTLLYAKFYSLHKSRSYTFKIRASNAAGLSKKEGIVYVDKSASKPDLPEGFSVIYYYRGIYELSWHRPSKSRSTDDLTDYTAFWCKSHRQMLDPCNTSVEWQRVEADVYVVNVTVLDSSSNYRFALAANGKTASSGMVWAKCMALYNGVLGKIKMLPLKVVGPDKIEVNWVVDCLDRTGRIVGFNISYCIFDNLTKSCKDGHPDYEFVPDCMKTSHVLSGLRPFTVYSVSIAAKTKSGHGEPCDAQQATTWEGVPGNPPHDVHLVSVTNHSISLDWKPPSNPNGIITYYEIEYGDDAMKVDVTEDNLVTAVDNILATVTRNVRSYTNYSIRVTACTMKGCSNTSSPIYITTDIGVPGQPDPPKVRLLNATHAIVSWDYPSTVGGPIDRWRLLVTWRTSDVSMDNMTMSVNNITTWIVPVRCDVVSDETEYFFAVSAVTLKNGEILAGNWSDFSAINACFADTFMGLSSGDIVAVAVGGAIGLAFLFLGFFFMVRMVRKRVQEMQKMKVDLPPGLVESFKRNLAPVKDSSEMALAIASARLYGRLQSVSSDEGRSSQDSGTTLNITSSLNSINDETLYTDKRVHGTLNKLGYGHVPSCDSSGCSSIVGSVSSSVTARTHLSSESSAEAELMTQLPLSPDLVFYDSLPVSTVNPASNWTTSNSAPPLPSSSFDCQLRLRNSAPPNNSEPEYGEVIISAVDESTNTVKPLTSSLDPNAHYSKVTTTRDDSMTEDESCPKLGQGYVCIGAGDTSDNKAVIVGDAAAAAADVVSKIRKNRKVSLPIGVVTKINLPNGDPENGAPATKSVVNNGAVGPYVAVALMTENEMPKSNPCGYSKFASAGVGTSPNEAPRSQIEDDEKTLPVSLLDFVLDDYDKMDFDLGPSIQVSGVGDKDGYVTAVSLDERPMPYNDILAPLGATNSVAAVTDLGSSWEMDLEASEENVTEEDIMSISPATPRVTNGYVTVSGGTMC